VFASTDEWAVRVWAFEGLSDRTIAGVARTPDGYLWLANRSGLVRFDGERFVEIGLDRFGLAAETRIRGIKSSRAGGLLVAVTDGTILHLLGDQSASLYQDERGQPVEAFAEDHAGALWILSERNRLVRMADGIATDFTGRAGLTTGNLQIVADAQARIWTVQNGMVSVFEGERFAWVATLPDTSIRATASASGGLWAYTNLGLFRIERDRPAQKVHPSPARAPTTLLEDRSGALWIGTLSSGLFRYVAGDMQRVPTSDATINALLEDHESTIWVGTRRAGLNQVQPRTLAVEGGLAGLTSDALQALAVHPDGTLWGLTNEGALRVRQNERWQPADLPNARLNRLTSLAIDAEGTIWNGSAHGNAGQRVYARRGGTVRAWGEAEGLTSATVTAMLAARDGNLWLIAGSPSSVARIRDDRLTLCSLPQPASGTRPSLPALTAIAEDAAGRIWLGGAHGELFSVRDDIIVAESRLSPHRRAIHALVGTPDGSLWLGYSAGGLGRLKDGHITLIRTDQGLEVGGITHLLPDARGGLWLAGEHGVFRAQLDDLHAVADGRADLVPCARYGPEEQGQADLHAFSISGGGAARTPDGRLWFTMGNALAILSARQLADEGVTPPARITRIALDDRPLALDRSVLPSRADPAPNLAALPLAGSALRLPPAHQTLTFEFTSLSLRAPQRVHFRYRLFGYDDDWIDAGAVREAVYRRLPAGDYRFEVRARNSNGLWNPTPAVVNVEVGRFVWQTWWFRTGAVVIFTASVFGLARRLTSRRLRQRLQRLRQQAAVERERARIARDIHDDIGNRLTRIILLAGLARRDQTDATRTGEHLQRIAQAASEVTDSLDEIVWAVNPGNDTLPHLVGYLGTTAVDFLRTAGLKHRLVRSASVPDMPVSAEVRHNLFLAVKEALTNVIRHAQASEVILTLEAGPGFLTAVVEDNGVGLRSGPDGPGADGLHNLRQRMEDIGGRFEIGPRPGGGTRVVLSAPLAQKA